MNTLYRVSILALFLGFSFQAMSQRITVRRSDGTIEDSQESRYQSNSSNHQPFAAKLHLSNIIFGEYLGSVEYAVTDFFTVEGGIGATSHGGNLLAGTELPLLEFYPSGSLESRGLGFSYIAEVRLYADEDALETDQYYGIGVHSKNYRYSRPYTGSGFVRNYDQSTRFRDYYFFYGYSMEFGDNIIVHANVDIGIRDILISGNREEFDQNTQTFGPVAFENDEFGFLYGLHFTVGYVFK